MINLARMDTLQNVAESYNPQILIIKELREQRACQSRTASIV